MLGRDYTTDEMERIQRVSQRGLGAMIVLMLVMAVCCVQKDAVNVASPKMVEAALDATLDASIEARVSAAVTSFETRIGKIETTLSNTTTTTTSTTAGRDVVESEVAKVLAAAMGQREWISLIKQLGLAAIAIPLGGWWYEKKRRPARLARERQSKADLNSDNS